MDGTVCINEKNNGEWSDDEEDQKKRRRRRPEETSTPSSKSDLSSIGKMIQDLHRQQIKIRNMYVSENNLDPETGRHVLTIKPLDHINGFEDNHGLNHGAQVIFHGQFEHYDSEDGVFTVQEYDAPGKVIDVTTNRIKISFEGDSVISKVVPGLANYWIRSNESE